MGFDIYGINPVIRAEKPQILNIDLSTANDDEKREYFKSLDEWEEENKGVYFRNNVWNWRPLWGYVCEVCEDIMSQQEIQAGYWNNGEVIDENKVSMMVDKLKIEIALGNHINFEKMYKKETSELPEEDCSICEGTGYRKEAPKVGAGEIPCNGCNNKGKRPSFDANYPFNHENVERFVEFLSESGGIQIW